MATEKEGILTGWNLENSYARLPERFYSKTAPTPVRAPELFIFNRALAAELGLDADGLESEEGAAILAGNQVPEGALPIAQAYAGHQFGNFTMLGDGRAVLLGEQMTPSENRLDIQLKGSGRTPFSRGGDGRATLGPMLREYIISEAMHGLGIPTSRSLAVTTTGEQVMRETALPGAVLTRVASSHLRFGTFEYTARWGKEGDLKVLTDYAIDRHYPEIKDDENPYLSLFKEVMKRHAELVAKWQLVGFIHGVMNTDNMTISGETIDYGPCAFMDQYDPKTVFSSIDVQGRYAYRNQPAITGWNLTRFAETLLPLINDDQDKAVEQAEEALSEFEAQYKAHYLAGMRAKLGLFNEEEQDEALIDELLRVMQEHQADYTNTFRALSLEKPEDTPMYDNHVFTEWYEKWKQRLSRQDESTDAACELMRKSNPAVIPRNHRVEEALEAAVEQGDCKVMERFMNALADPYAYSKDQEEYAELPEPSHLPYRTYCGT
ncbi:YdiU family protein [Halobacillus salinarum]|uniref:Protein nucleotidyltransferase YdiU n=1 Tax=Halobacillus salinarum TaxID=2932257 RepID=A0ABY4EN97_9BACI|nr:YdiU family protein [Halobacillus salinarum]UOQ45455.1 YdiU family protein [Halobacillus salinarum]